VQQRTGRRGEFIRFRPRQGSGVEAWSDALLSEAHGSHGIHEAGSTCQGDIRDVDPKGARNRQRLNTVSVAVSLPGSRHAVVGRKPEGSARLGDWYDIRLVSRPMRSPFSLHRLPVVIDFFATVEACHVRTASDLTIDGSGCHRHWKGCL